MKIATTTFCWNSWWKNTSVMNSAWKIGVNSHASSSTGFAPGDAGTSGACECVGGGPPLPAGASPSGAGAHRYRRARGRPASMPPRRGRWRRAGAAAGAGGAGGGGASRGSSIRLGDRVVPARVPGVATADALGAHDGPAQQAVLPDRLFGVARARGLEAAARGHPGEHDTVEADEPRPDRDPQASHVSA